MYKLPAITPPSVPYARVRLSPNDAYLSRTRKVNLFFVLKQSRFNAEVLLRETGPCVKRCLVYTLLQFAIQPGPPVCRMVCRIRVRPRLRPVRSMCNSIRAGKFVEEA